MLKSKSVGTGDSCISTFFISDARQFIIYRILPYPTISYHILPYPTVSYRILPYPTVFHYFRYNLHPIHSATDYDL
ncbi:hypothetical protein KCTCHS21_06490 [Cohnella abietis]|uniref:Uncharacterized protein n=1 Tax=Cohnella abietis TaxID=2507935 RepID=A0A3T1CZI1_9BACL|nr:hypothetical protein KCTCHS21_06490 [Cohnella abietis]